MAFAKEVAAFQKKTERSMRVVLRLVGLEGSRRLIFKTPVDTGQARGGWRGSLEGAGRGRPRKFDKGGGITLSKIAKAFSLSRIVLGRSLWIYNNVAHIEVLEKGRHRAADPRSGKTRFYGSKQAPQGMLKVTVAEMQSQGFMARIAKQAQRSG